MEVHLTVTTVKGKGTHNYFNWDRAPPTQFLRFLRILL